MNFEAVLTIYGRRLSRGKVVCFLGEVFIDLVKENIKTVSLLISIE